MASAKLILKSKKSNVLATVFLRYRHGQEIDLTVPTEFFMYPNYWNNKSQAFSSRITYTDEFTPIEKDELEKKFRNLKTYILNKLNSTIHVSRESLQRLVAEFHDPNARFKHKISLNEYIPMFIEECDEGIRLTERSTRMSPSTTKSFKAFFKQFTSYQTEKMRTLNYDDITLDFLKDFVRYFNKKDYSPNTINKYVKILKLMVRSARDEELNNNHEIDKRKFKVPPIDVKTIYLNTDELKRMYELDLSSDPTLEKIRDVFLIGCYTAQRYSDYSTIQKDNIIQLDNGLKVIELSQQKTNETVVIPIRPELDALLAKYGYTVPKTFDQKVNKGIKEVGKLVQIDEAVVIDKYQGGRKVSVTIPKYNLIQTHTARRSGCTNMYLAGIPTIDIMKISGHKTEKEFLKYIRVSKKQTAQTLAVHPYFSGKGN